MINDRPVERKDGSGLREGRRKKIVVVLEPKRGVQKLGTTNVNWKIQGETSGKRALHGERGREIKG